MPISIGSLRAVDTPSIPSSFNTFLHRLPPPQKFVFEARQVLPGDVVDPYEYLRSLFRGEVVLSTKEMPTFAVPRVSDSTRETFGVHKHGGTSYTTRSPQGFNPWLKTSQEKSTRPTSPASLINRPTTPSSFFGSIGHSSKGENENIIKQHLPVGMLGTPVPDFSHFLANPASNPSSSHDNLAVLRTAGRSKIKQIDQDNYQTRFVETKMVYTTRAPSFTPLPAVPDNLKPPGIDLDPIRSSSSFSFQPAVSVNSRIPKFETNIDPDERENRFSSFTNSQDLSFDRDKEEALRLFHEKLLAGRNSAVMTENNDLDQSEALRKLREKLIAGRNPATTTGKSDLDQSEALRKLRAKLIADENAVTTKDQEQNDSEALKKLRQKLLAGGSPAIPSEEPVIDQSEALRTLRAKLLAGATPATFPVDHPTLSPSRESLIKPETGREGILSVEKSNFGQLSVNPTEQPRSIFTTVRSPTQRAKVLNILQQLLISRQTTILTTTTSPPTTTTESTTVARPPSLRFEELNLPSIPMIPVDLTPPPLPPNVTPGTPIHPYSPFPFLEPPQRDLISSNLFLPDRLEMVTPSSILYPTSPFPKIEAPKLNLEFQDPSLQFFPTPGGSPDFINGVSYDPGSLDVPGRADHPTQEPRGGKELINHNDPKYFTPRPGLEAPPSIYPVPRTRMIAPRSQQTALFRRLSIDGPTESSLTPLEILAKETVPKFKPDNSFFGTPRAVAEENQTPLESILSDLKGSNTDYIFRDMDPVQRTRYQRQFPNNPPALTFQNNLPKTQTEINPSHEDKPKSPVNAHLSPYDKLPGVKTGTTAVGLVEHRDGNQPLFHVPIFTTPIPKNGKFINLNSNPLTRIQKAVENFQSNLPSPIEGFNAVKNAISNSLGLSSIPVQGGTRASAIVSNFKEVPRPHPTQRSVIGRPLDTFPRYTKMSNFVNSSSPNKSVLTIPVLVLYISTFILGII